MPDHFLSLYLSHATTQNYMTKKQLLSIAVPTLCLSTLLVNIQLILSIGLLLQHSTLFLLVQSHERHRHHHSSPLQLRRETLSSHQQQQQQQHASHPSLPPHPHKSIKLNSPGGCNGREQAHLDIYYGGSSNSTTTNNTTTTIILHIPGGAYQTLSSRTITTIAPLYLTAGYALAVLYYRLPRNATERQWIVCADPWEAVEDVAAAMRELSLLYHHVDDDEANSSSIVVSGFSAGGHLAALYGTMCSSSSSSGGSTTVANDDDKPCPRALVLHFPFLLTGAKILCTPINKAFRSTSDYDSCDPTSLVRHHHRNNNTSMMPPVILYHASGDTIVSTKWMTDFVEALKKGGVRYEYYEVSGGGHYAGSFESVVAASGGVFSVGDDYSKFIERAVILSSSDDNDCIQCDDTPSPYMLAHGKTCNINGSWFINNRCNEDDIWRTAGYCRQSCHDAKRGYDQHVPCCPRPTTTPLITPSSSSSCTMCDDDPTPWMTKKGKTCSGCRYAIERMCNERSYWVSNGFCRLSCYKAGRGYTGDVCC